MIGEYPYVLPPLLQVLRGIPKSPPPPEKEKVREIQSNDHTEILEVHKHPGTNSPLRFKVKWDDGQVDIGSEWLLKRSFLRR